MLLKPDHHHNHSHRNRRRRFNNMAFSEFRPLDENSLIDYIKATPILSDKIGNKFDDLKIKEVGDGNLNFVYIVVSSAGSFVIKQVKD